MKKTNLLFLLTAALAGLASCTYSKSTPATSSLEGPSNIVNPSEEGAVAGGGTGATGATGASGATSSTGGPAAGGLRVYQDADGDGYGNPAKPMDLVAGAATPAGYVADNTDCNDNNAKVHPGAKQPSTLLNSRYLLMNYRILRLSPTMIDWNCDGTYGYLPATSTDSDSTPKVLDILEYSFDAGASKLTMKNHGDGDATITDTKEWTFDASGNQLTERDYSDGPSKPVNVSVAWTYDEHGNPLTSLQYDGDIGSHVANTTVWTYDAHGNLATVMSYSGDVSPANLDSSVGAAYDTSGNLLTIQSYRGDLIAATFEYTYDAGGNLSTLKMHDGDLSATVKYAVKWTYDTNGHAIKEEDHDGDLSAMPLAMLLQATYDADGNQAAMVATDSKSHSSSEEMTYDSNGNELTRKYHSGADVTSSPVTETIQSSGYFPIKFRWNPDAVVRRALRE